MTKNIMKTFSTTSSDIARKWYIIDAENLILGRMSVIIADYLRGKHKVYYTPNMDCGDYIVVINAEKVALTGNKESKRFYWHTGYPGGIKHRTMKQMRKDTPERIIENSVRRMIGRNSLGRTVMKKLHVYLGSNHPHVAQNPEFLDIKSMNNKNTKRS